MDRIADELMKRMRVELSRDAMATLLQILCVWKLGLIPNSQAEILIRNVLLRHHESNLLLEFDIFMEVTSNAQDFEYVL